MFYWDKRVFTTAETRENTRYKHYVFCVVFYMILGIAGLILALATGLKAWMEGHRVVLAWLFLGHLPWGVLYLLSLRAGKNSPKERKPNPHSLGPIGYRGNWMKGSTTEDGMFLQIFFLRWQLFRYYQFVKQTDDFLVFRFWCRRDEERTDTERILTLPPKKPNGDSWWKKIAWNMPIAVTILALVVGGIRFGWRTDILASLYLASHYTLIEGLEPWKRMIGRKVTCPPMYPCMDVAFDSRKVTLEEATKFIEERVPHWSDLV